MTFFMNNNEYRNMTSWLSSSQPGLIYSIHDCLFQNNFCGQISNLGERMDYADEHSRNEFGKGEREGGKNGTKQQGGK